MKYINTVLNKSLISEVTICPEFINALWNFGLRIVSFNYHSPYTFEILKTSKNKTTTHFRELEGMDYYYKTLPTDMKLVKFSDIPFVYPNLNHN